VLLTRRLAAVGLPGGPAAVVEEPLAPATWTQFHGEVRQHHLEGRLDQAIAEGAMAVTEEQHELVLTSFSQRCVALVTLDREVVHVHRTLEAERIPSRVLKGTAHAHLLYDQPGTRTYVDVDVLVPSGAIDDARHALERAGGTRTYAEPRPGFDRRFGKGATFTMPSAHGVDLHRTLTTGAYGLSVIEADLFSSASWFSVAGERMRALDPINMFLHCCLTVGLEPGARLASQRDLAELALGPELDPFRVLSRATQWRMLAVVAAAVGRSWEQLDLDPTHPWAEWATTYVPSRRERRWMAPYVAPGATYAGQTLGAIEAIPGWRPKLAYLRAMAMPDPDTGREPWPDRARTAWRALQAWRPTDPR